MSKNFEDEISSNYRRFCLINEERAKSFFNKRRADFAKMYSDKMQQAFNDRKTHFSEDYLQMLHDVIKNDLLEVVCSILH